MDTPADQLASSLDAAAFIPFLLASIALAAAYGASFLLADHLRYSGLDPAMAGAVISTGIVTMIVSSLFAGWAAQRIGLMSTIVAAPLCQATCRVSFLK